MAAYVDLFQLAFTESRLRNQVSIATFLKVDAIAALGTPDAGLLSWAVQAYEQESQTISECAGAVLSENKDQTVDAINTVADSVVEAQTSLVVDKYVQATIWPT